MRSLRPSRQKTFLFIYMSAYGSKPKFNYQHDNLKSMDIIYLLLPVALIIVIIIIAVFFWAVKSDQFDDLEGPAYRILMDDDEKSSTSKKNDSNTDHMAD